MRVSLRSVLPLLLACTVGACERVTAPEADAAAQTLEKLVTTDPWSRQATEYQQSLEAASGILRRLDGTATRIVVDRDGHQETFNAVVFAYEFGAPGQVEFEDTTTRRTLVAWQTPGVRNLVMLRVGSAPDPFHAGWPADTTDESVRAYHELIRSEGLDGKQAYLFARGLHFWRADGGVATVGPATGIGQRCADGARTEDLLDQYSGMASAVSCHAASFPIAFDLTMTTNRHDVSPETLKFGQFDRRYMDPRWMRLVVPSQLVRGVRFTMPCDHSPSETVRSRCREASISPASR